MDTSEVPLDEDEYTLCTFPSYTSISLDEGVPFSEFYKKQQKDVNNVKGSNLKKIDQAQYEKFNDVEIPTLSEKNLKSMNKQVGYE